MQSSKYQAGVKLFTEIHGGLSAEETVKNLSLISPEMARMTMEWIFGDLYANNVIDMRIREVSNISSLVAIEALPQLRNHIFAALKLGFSPEEIKHIILNTSIIVGFPKVVNSLMVLKEILEEKEKKDE